MVETVSNWMVAASSSGVSRDEREARATGNEREARGTTGRKKKRGVPFLPCALIAFQQRGALVRGRDSRVRKNFIYCQNMAAL